MCRHGGQSCFPFHFSRYTLGHISDALSMNKVRISICFSVVFFFLLLTLFMDCTCIDEISSAQLLGAIIVRFRLNLIKRKNNEITHAIAIKPLNTNVTKHRLQLERKRLSSAIEQPQ